MSKESDVKFCSKYDGCYHRWTQYNLCFGWKLRRHIHCDGKRMKARPPMEGDWGEIRWFLAQFFQRRTIRHLEDVVTDGSRSTGRKQADAVLDT